MIDWKIWDEEPALPEPSEDPEPEPGGSRRGLALLLLALLLIGGVALSYFVREREAQRQRDIEQAVLEEERALSFGLVEEAQQFADPAAARDWYFRYEALYHFPGAGRTVTEPQSIEHQAGIALVTLSEEQAEAGWKQLHAYRLVGGRWRRTEVPANLWEEHRSFRSTRFDLWLNERDLELLDPEALLTFLEHFRAQFEASWSPAHESRIILQARPDDLAPPIIEVAGSGTSITFNSPLLATHLAPYLPPRRAYHLALANAVAAALDRSPPSASPQADGLRTFLREALVRHLVLTEEERRSHREWSLKRMPGQLAIDSSIDSHELIYLIDYLVVLEGPTAPVRLAHALHHSTDLHSAVVQAFGFSLDSLLYESHLWQSAESAPEQEGQAGQRQIGTVLRLMDDLPFEAMLLLDHGDRLVRFQAESHVSLPVRLPCLGTGSRLSFTELPGEAPDGLMLGRAPRLDVAHLPPWPASNPLPPGAHTLVARWKNGNTRILALGEADNETELFLLPGEIQLATHPGAASFAFLYRDSCGTSVNFFRPQEGQLLRLPASLAGTGHLLWGDELYLLDDATATERPHWSLTSISGDSPAPPRARPVDPTFRWGQSLGYDRSRGRHLISLPEAGLFWFSPTRWMEQEEEALQPASLDLPPGATPRALAPDGRWLAYTVETAGPGGSELHLLDLPGSKHHLLYRAGKGLTFGEMTWSRAESPFLVSVLEFPEGVHSGWSALFLFVPPVNPGSTIWHDTFGFEGVLEELYPCADGRLLYRLSDGEASSLMEGFQAHPRRIGTGGQVLGCLSPSPPR